MKYQVQNAPYDFYEIHFGIENFMHLAGIQSETIRAKNFLDACANGKVKIEDCKPRHSVSNRNSKVMLLGQLLDFRHSKCYKIGEKYLVTKDNDFEMAIGNTSGVVGFDPRVSKKGSKEIDKKHLPIPITLLTNMQGTTIPEELCDWRMGKGSDTGILWQEMMLTDKVELKIIDAREWKIWQKNYQM